MRHRNPLARDYVIVSRVVLVGYPELSDGAKVTYWVIYSHDWYDPGRGGRKGYVYPTVGRLAVLRHSTSRTIQRHLVELINAGLLTRAIRRGKPSILYIEEPREDEIERCNKEGRGDISVGRGVTFLSPQQEDEENQKKAVNGVGESLMEEERHKAGGLKPIGDLLGLRHLQRNPVNRTEWLANQILIQTGDSHSLGCYRAVARRCPETLIFEALSLLREARRDGTVRRTKGALFIGITRRLCSERGVPDPFDRGGLNKTAVGHQPLEFDPKGLTRQRLRDGVDLT